MFRPHLIALVTCALGLAPAVSGTAEPPAAESAAVFIKDAEARLTELGSLAERASWIQSTHITEDTEILSALHEERFLAAQAELAKKAARFKGETGDIAR